MTIEVTLRLRDEDAEPILRTHAELAAKYSALLDHVTRRTHGAPVRMGERFDEARERWQRQYLRSKRIVDAFGVEFSPTSEEETSTITWPHTKGGKRELVDLAGFKFNKITGAKTDYSRPVPTYRSGVHSDACEAAARRTVKAWRESIAGKSGRPDLEAFNQEMAERRS